MESASMERPNLNPARFANRTDDAVELRKLILKLRWIGHEVEAERLCAVLGSKAPGQICVEQPMLTD